MNKITITFLLTNFQFYPYLFLSGNANDDFVDVNLYFMVNMFSSAKSRTRFLNK